jgi:hypothetical protein
MKYQKIIIWRAFLSKMIFFSPGLFLPTRRTHMWTHTISFFPALHTASHPRRARVATWHSGSAGGNIETGRDREDELGQQVLGRAWESIYPWSSVSPTPIGSKLPLACAPPLAAPAAAAPVAAHAGSAALSASCCCSHFMISTEWQWKGRWQLIFPLRFGRYLMAWFLFRHWKDQDVD